MHKSDICGLVTTMFYFREVHKESLEEIKSFIKEENNKKLEAKERRHQERSEQINVFLEMFKSSINKNP